MRHLKLEPSHTSSSDATGTSLDRSYAALLVAGGKGGVGTSVLASLAALSAAERGDNVLLVDATETSGSLHLLFGLRPTTSLWSLISTDVPPVGTLMMIGSGLTVVSGGTSAAAVLPTNANERRAALNRLATVFEEFDVVIIDGGSRLDSIAAVQELVDPLTLVVTSADRLALAANYALIKSIAARKSDASIAVVANRHTEKVADEACEFLVGACDHFLGRSVDVVGIVPDDPCLQAAVGAGMTVRDALDGSPAAEAMRGVLSRMIPPRHVTPRVSLTLPVSPSRRWS